jgi:hypothetical protein
MKINYQSMMQIGCRFLIIAICAFVLHACSIVGQYSTYWVESDDKSNQSIIKQDMGNKQIHAFLDSCTGYCPFDSILFDLDLFNGGMVFLFGLPYIPVIPNILYPITYYCHNRTSDYMISISAIILDTISLDSFRFYRNTKLLIPESITINGRKISLLGRPVSEHIIYPGSYHLSFIFRVKKVATKRVEIKYNDQHLLNIKRKKKLYHKVIFTN